MVLLNKPYGRRSRRRTVRFTSPAKKKGGRRGDRPSRSLFSAGQRASRGFCGAGRNIIRAGAVCCWTGAACCCECVGSGLPVETPPGKVEVVEGFWYGCGHCAALEPRVESWQKSKPDWIVLKRLPVIWNEVTTEDARLYYAIESLGLVDKLHAEVFREIHTRKHPITVIRGGRVDKAATEKAAREFLAANGVSAQDFAKVYRSFSTENKLRQAANLSRRYLMDHTPMFVVHGRYLTDADMAGGVDGLFQLVNDLSAREHDGT